MNVRNIENFGPILIYHLPPFARHRISRPTAAAIHILSAVDQAENSGSGNLIRRSHFKTQPRGIRKGQNLSKPLVSTAAPWIRFTYGAHHRLGVSFYSPYQTESTGGVWVMGLSMNAVDVASILTRAFYADSQDIEFGNPWWFVYAGVSCFLVLFGGIMSGLTLGLMSLGQVELEILKRSGTSTEKKQAATIYPVVQKQHQLLVTLLLCNAAAMEALPIYLDKLFHPAVAVILSVTFVLAFGEIIPQAVCSRYGLAVGANCVWLVRILMVVCYPISYPIGKILDAVLGHHEVLFRRPQLKALVSIHSQEAGKGGELTHDEATIISGALDLTEKYNFSASLLLREVKMSSSMMEAIGRILARGHSRIPVYSENPKNIIGLLLVKSLLTVRAETETPVSAVSIRRIPRVPADMPLYDILNEFQKGSSHMAAVVKVREKDKRLHSSSGNGTVGEKKFTNVASQLTIPLLYKQDGQPNRVVINIEKSQQNGLLTNSWNHAVEDIEDGEVIGIITLEDVFEELLQEEIVDETDVYVDVHKRIRVAAAAAASSVARAPSTRRLTGQKPSSPSALKSDWMNSVMGFKKVYNSLLEVFPQIDSRALRAVSIEHYKDVDAAVQAVLEEIIPFFVEKSRPSSPLTRSISKEKLSEAPLGAISSTQSADDQSVNTVGPAEMRNGHTVNSGDQQSFNDVDNGNYEPFYDTYDGHHEGEGNTAELALLEESHESRINASADVCSYGGEPVALIDNNGVNTLQVEIPGDLETEKTGSADKCSESSVNVLSDVIPCHTLGTQQDMDMGINETFLQEREDLDAYLEAEFGTANEKKDLKKSYSDGNNSVDGTASLTVRDLTMSSLDSSVQLVEVPDIHESNLGKLEVCFSDDTASKMESMSNIVGTGNGTTLSSSMSQSSQLHIMDVLEETIEDARNNKKTLFSAMESVLSMMKEVELKEKAAEEAKEEASIGGNSILDKVAELKRMLQHAKEANDMVHAGEVYGEKAILATELRELQSRVLSLSDERDNSLSVLDQMRQTLEVRLAAAENEIRSVELEKLEKEKAARKLLADQELIMEQVVKESNILKQQAADNAKLQEFLLDRGRIVDMLQGELAVICQDVRLLKEKFDENVPFSKSLSSSQTSCILASSSSSLKSLIPEQVERDSFETQKERDPILCSDELVSENELVRDDGKPLPDDGWDFLDSCEIDA
ncbi:hypothetical protein BUALT_Bualt02G0222500 [Buddleja alternifolia]|uniref:CNNM transmembrane domain-containing protein n=2 Tax=Magnoliopsida TaxID=3398 RepID=A0AAV6Y3S8_9LAMI|nr:hypothetical protein BUALT_Bualt02G0222500 [Buddleja alternifolia]